MESELNKLKKMLDNEKINYANAYTTIPYYEGITIEGNICMISARHCNGMLSIRSGHDLLHGLSAKKVFKRMKYCLKNDTNLYKENNNDN